MQKQIQGHENNEGNPDAGPQGSKKPTKPKKKHSGKCSSGNNNSYPEDHCMNTMHDGSDNESIHKGG